MGLMDMMNDGANEPRLPAEAPCCAGEGCGVCCYRYLASGRAPSQGGAEQTYQDIG